MTYFKDLKTLTEQVEEILRDHPRTRDSDQVLYLMLLNQVYNIDYDASIRDVYKMVNNGALPCHESVSRARRKIQESGLYPATKIIGQQRKALEKDIRGQIKLL